MMDMRVEKRNGMFEDVSFDKVINRIKVLSNDTQINVVQIAQKVCARIYDGVHTSDLDELAAQICSSMILDHPDYGKIAGRIIISNHQKNTSPSFSETVQILYINNGNTPVVSEELYDIVMANKEKLNSCIDYTRDFNFDYFGFKTLEKSYLLKVGEKVIERPQHMFMRVSIGIHKWDIKDVIETYELMSNQYCIHATPTLFNSGTPRQQMSSCFLGGVHEDSIVDIYDTLKEVAQISKYAGGVGIHIHNVRGKNSVIHGTNGKSTGIVPMLRVFNNTARYVNQCFTPDTIINVLNGCKPICEIEQGEYVLTSGGDYQPVLKVFSNHVKNRQILKFNSKHLANPISVTNEHKLYIFDNVSRTEMYIYADEFDVNIHEMCYPIEKTIYKTNQSLEYFKFYGLFMRNGIIMSNTYAYIFGDCNEDYLFVREYLNNNNIKYVVDEYSRQSLVWEYNSCLGIEYNMVYDLEGYKKIYPLYTHLDMDSTTTLLYGLTGLDTYCTSNINMIHDVTFMWLRVSKNFLHIKRNILDKYEVNFNIFSVGYVRDNKIWFKIDSIEKVNFTGYTYDLCVDQLHNYTTAMGLVHNSGRRNGSIAVYLEPWHTDIESFLELRKNNGNEEERARDLFYALWIPDLFMQRVKENGKWSLMCPNTCRGLSDVYGDKFETMYKEYEEKSMYTKQINAQDLWFKILESQIETGVPYMMYKDHVNKKSNQKNLGTIKSSNLCVTPDTLVYTDNGHFHIGYLATLCNDLNYYVNVWNGQEFSPVKVLKTGSAEQIVEVVTSNGLTIQCTEYHKFYLKDGTMKTARELDSGDMLETCDLPLVTNSTWGSVEKRSSLISNYFDNYHTIKTTRGSYYDFIVDIDVKDESLRLLYILQTLGVKSNILDNNNLHIKNNDLIKLVVLVDMEIDGLVYDPAQDDNIIVNSVNMDTRVLSDTFCFSEPKRMRGVFNGILTGNCTEIVEYTSQDQWAVCNLASMCLPRYIETGEDGKPFFNFEKLHIVTKTLVKNLNKVIDSNFYPIEKAAYSNFQHRPIGLGVQGLADTFVKLRYPFESLEAFKLNRDIFETIYHGALESSNDLAIKLGKTYFSFEGSPASKGILQFDMWDVIPGDRYDWDLLKKSIVEKGLLNSLLVAPMPTASTSQICGFNESFEAFTSNIYKRKTLAGEFIVVNKYLIEDLQKLGLWNTDMKNKIILSEGSVQKIPEVPQDIKDLYKMVWEIKQKVIIDMAADRGAFVDQSQSMNLFMENPDFKKLSSMHFYSWQKGLKTGMYYLRSKAKAKAQQFTMDPKLSKYTNIKEEMEQQACENCSA